MELTPTTYDDRRLTILRDIVQLASELMDAPDSAGDTGVVNAEEADDYLSSLEDAYIALGGHYSRRHEFIETALAVWGGDMKIDEVTT